MAAKYHQISFKETFSQCQDLFFDDVPPFFQLLDQHLDLDDFIPSSFFNAFYRSLGRKHLYPLSGFLAALILQKIFPFLLTPCSSCSLTSVKNFVISAALKRFLTPLFLLVSGTTFFLLFRICSNSLLILLSPFARLSILTSPRFSPLIPPAASLP